MSRPSQLSPLLLLFLVAAPARAALWEPRPGVALTANDGVAQRLELVDLDADGFVDIVVPYSGGDSVGGDADAQLNRIFLNQSGQKFVELVGVFDEPDHAYVIKAGDLDGDGDSDLVVGVNFSGESYLLINDGGALTRQDLFPGQTFSIGDLELGDVDLDGDLDIVAADWGASQPFGEPDDPGAPLRLWLGQGDGTFVDGAAFLPLGMDAQFSWSFDLELFDLQNNHDLDIVVVSRGPGPARLLINDGAGAFTSAAMLSTAEINFAVTPIDFDGNGFVDLVGLQDGGEDCEVQDGGKVCGARNSIALGNGGDFFGGGTFWAAADNPPGADLDAATLDVDNNGTPDLLISGQRLGPADNSTLLLANSGDALTIAAVDPLGATLDRGVGLMFADFDHDRREDVAVAVRDAAAPNLVLFGGTAPPDQVPEDTSPPWIDSFEKLPEPVLGGQTVTVRARVHDHKTPTRWHDFLFDPELATLNLVDGAETLHHRRLPYFELAVGLADPSELDTLPDTGPDKLLVPGVWYGEALWSFSLPIPSIDGDTLSYRLCAIDAAGNKACFGAFQTAIQSDICGDGICAPPEDPESCPQDCPCDNDGICEPNEQICCDCDSGPGCGDSCGDGFCDEPLENSSNCPQDCQQCDNDAICEPGEGEACCDCSFCENCGDGVCAAPDETEANCPIDCLPDDCVTDGCVIVCGDGRCEGPESSDDCPADCPADTDTDAATGGEDLVQPGCLCRDAPASGALGLLLLLARRRRART